MKNPLIITLDGPSGSGKSTASLELAKHYQVPCLDTGAMYRTVAYRALQRQLSLSDEDSLCRIARAMKFSFGIENNHKWVAVEEDGALTRIGSEIRTPEVSLAASKVAKMPRLRRLLVQKQQEIGKQQGAVVEGRDAGTVIFPKALVKFFVTASAEERAKRRHRELSETYGIGAQTFEDVLREIRDRDQQDEERLVSPSKPADDAILVDTSGLSLEKVVEVLISKVDMRLGPTKKTLRFF